MYGRFLYIDLDRELVREKRFKEDIVKSFIGGKGIGAYILYKELKSKTDLLVI